MYLAHLEKDCLLLDLDARWRPEAATSVSHGLAAAGDESVRPSPAIARQPLTQVAAAMGLRGQLTLRGMICRTFLPKVQSEGSPLPKQRAGEDLLSEERLERRAAIGLAKRKLLIKLPEGSTLRQAP